MLKIENLNSFLLWPNCILTSLKLTIIAFEQKLVSIWWHLRHHLARKAYIMAINDMKYTTWAKRRTVMVVSTNADRIRFKCQGGLLKYILTIVQRESRVWIFCIFHRIQQGVWKPSNPMYRFTWIDFFFRHGFNLVHILKSIKNKKRKFPIYRPSY